MENLIHIGMLVVFVGIALIVAGSFFQMGTSEASGESKSRFFAGGFLGFIPFGFGNDKKLFWIGVVLTVAMVAVMFFVHKR